MAENSAAKWTQFVVLRSAGGGSPFVAPSALGD